MTNITKTILLSDARIVRRDGIAESASLLIESGRIARIFDSSSVESVKADSIIDLDGFTLFPGFIDIHIHGAVGVDAMEASADDLIRVAEFLATRGVTAWLPTLVPSPQEQYLSAVHAIDELMRKQSSDVTSSALNADKMSALTAAARVLGVHYEGPFVNSGQCGALHRDHFRMYAGAASLDDLPTIENESAVHMMTLAPEIDGGVDLVRALTRRGWVASIGHTRATVEILDRAFEAGAHHMTHFMNAMSPLHQRAPGPVGWGLLRDDVTCDVIADGIHINPLMLKLILRSKTARKVSLISDSIAAAGLGDGDYDVWGEKISVRNGRTQNSRGAIAGSVITMLDAAQLMLTLGASEVEVAHMASTNPAQLLGIGKDCGSIEEGKRADLVALDQERKVRLTIIGGRVSEAPP